MRRIASTHKGDARVSLRSVGRITLVEDQIEHGGDGPETLCSFDRIWRFEGSAVIRYPALRARDPLFERGLANQESARDLRDAQAGDDAQRERDLLRGRQVLVTADEEKAQHVVADARVVHGMHDGGLGIFETGELRVVLRQLPQPR